MSIQTAREKWEEIGKERIEGANTARRVGEAGLAILDAVDKIDERFENLYSMVSKGMLYKGVAELGTNPGNEENVFYTAMQPGMYANFSGIRVYTGEVCVLYKDENDNRWWKRIIAPRGGVISVDLDTGTGLSILNTKTYPGMYLYETQTTQESGLYAFTTGLMEVTLQKLEEGTSTVYQRRLENNKVYVRSGVVSAETGDDYTVNTWTAWAEQSGSGSGGSNINSCPEIIDIHIASEIRELLLNPTTENLIDEGVSKDEFGYGIWTRLLAYDDPKTARTFRLIGQNLSFLMISSVSGEVAWSTSEPYFTLDGMNATYYDSSTNSVWCISINLSYEDTELHFSLARRVLSLNDLFPIELTVTGGGLYEKGTTQTITINWSIKGTGENVIPSSLMINGEKLDVTSTSKTYTGVSSNKTYIVVATIDGKALSKTVTANFVGMSYYGVTGNQSPTSVEILTGSKALKASKGYTVNSINLANQRSYYAYPASMGNLTSIKDGNNFEYIGSYTKSTVTLLTDELGGDSSETYNVYTLTDAVTISNLKLTYS